ncbi:MAG: hypothetical protein WBV75_11480, partial [Robiginitalea sp.]
MRVLRIHLFLFALAMFMLSVSCKDELIFEEPQMEQAMSADSKVASLLYRMTLNDGSKDNILDQANCFTIKLPVVVLVDGEEVVIQTQKDLKEIRKILKENDKDNDDDDDDE